MALEISKSETSKLIIQGTSIELDSIYARISMNANANGIDMRLNIFHYENKEAWAASTPIVKLMSMPTTYNAEAEEEQSILVASEKVKAQLEDAGYSVAIIDL